MNHRKSYVWLNVIGGVMGIQVEELNYYIQQYNKKICRFYPSSFWEYLSYELDTDIHGFSVLWNEHNPRMREVITIKG